MAHEDNQASSEQGIQKEAWDARAPASSDDHEEDVSRSIVLPESNKPGRLAIAFRIFGILVSLLLAVGVVAELRALDRDSRLNENGKAGLACLAAVFGIPTLIFGVYWTTQAIRRRTQTGPIHAAKFLFGLLLFAACVTGSLNIKSPMGIISVGYMGYAISFCHGVGAGLGLCLILSGVWGLIGCASSWRAWTICFVSVVLCLSVSGPTISAAFYEHEEEAVWQFINHWIMPSGELYEPNYHDWDWKYFSRIPEQFQRPDSRAHAMKMQLDKHSHWEIPQIIIDTKRFEDRPGVAPLRPKAILIYADFVRNIELPQNRYHQMLSLFHLSKYGDPEIQRFKSQIADDLIQDIRTGRLDRARAAQILDGPFAAQQPNYRSDPDWARIFDAYDKHKNVPKNK